MQPISFFFDNIGQQIKRGDTTLLVTKENYQKLYEIQSPGYTFMAIPRIYKIEDRVCESCSS